jgi:hypothetical protein
MSPIGLGLDIILMLLLITALGVGLRLNRRLSALRDGHSAFAKAVAELNAAAARAETGLVQLRTAADETHDALLTRIETARGLITKLETASAAAERTVEKAAAIAAAMPAPRPAAASRPLRFADPQAGLERGGLERGSAERGGLERMAAAADPFDLPLDNPVPVETPTNTHEERLTFPSRRRFAADEDLFEEQPRRSGGR